MKIFRKLASALMVLPVLAALTACESEAEYTAAEQLTNAQVFFANDLPATQNIAIDGTSFDVPIQRANTNGELTVQVKAEQDEANIFTIPESVTFADGEGVANLTITYPAGSQEYDVFHNVTLSLADEKYTTPYGDATYAFQAGPVAPWEDMGYAIYREDMVSHWFGVENLEYQVPMQKNSITPGLYRLVNPYGRYYPYNEPGDYDASAMTYWVIHAEDPDYVWLEEHNSTMDWGYGAFSFSTHVAMWVAAGNDIEDIKASRPEKFGKLENGIITFPNAQCLIISMANYNDGGWYFANDNGLFAIALPGYELVSYDFSAEASFVGTLKGVDEKYQAVVDFTLGADVATAKYVMTTKDQSEATVAAAIVAGEIEATEITSSERVYLPLEEEGSYRVTIVTFDANGEAQESASTSFEFEAGASSWESLGTGLYTEDFLTTFYKVEPQTYEVEILASTKTPGVYRLKNPYGAAYPYNEEGDWDASMDYFIEINAENPDFVYIPQQESGLDWGNGMMSIVSMGARYVAAYPDYPVTMFADYAPFGTLADGVITFPQYVGEDEEEVPALLVSLADYDGGSLYPANSNGAFKVVLPAATSPSARKAAKFASRLRGKGGFTAPRQAKKATHMRFKKMNKLNEKAVSLKF